MHLVQAGPAATAGPDLFAEPVPRLGPSTDVFGLVRDSGRSQDLTSNKRRPFPFAVLLQPVGKDEPRRVIVRLGLASPDQGSKFGGHVALSRRRCSAK